MIGAKPRRHISDAGSGIRKRRASVHDLLVEVLRENAETEQAFKLLGTPSVLVPRKFSSLPTPRLEQQYRIN